LFTDGASRGNPGPAAVGYIVKDSAGRIVAEHAECIGHATNNQAEYRALILGLRAASEFGAGYVTWVSDSQLVVRQMQGTYRVKHSYLKQLHEQASAALAAFAHVVMEHRPRSDPDVADIDRMINKALDKCI
jgi:ribonuclease HI